MKTVIDPSPDADLDNVAQIAFGIAEKIRDDDPRRLFDNLAHLCHWHPAKAAQIIMAFAAWFDPETPVRELWARVVAISEDRTKKVGAA